MKAAVHRLDEHVCRPGTRVRTVAPVEVHRRPRGLDLLERHALVDQVLHAVANHRQHVAVRRDIGRIRQPAAARNDPRAALAAVLGNGEIENLIQAVDDALNAAALLDVDDGIADGRKEVAGADHFGVTEEHDAVAVRVRRRRVIDDHRFTVEVFRQLVELVEIRVGRPRCRRRAACLPAGALIRFSTFSCATIDAVRPTSRPPRRIRRRAGRNPAAASFSLPPMCSAAALVLMM